MVLGQMSETGTVPHKPTCRIFWLLIAVYETTPKSSGFKQPFDYISCFFEPGSQAESNWVIFLFHVASAGVSWWYSPGHWSGLEGLKRVHSHAYCIDRDNWK